MQARKSFETAVGMLQDPANQLPFMRMARKEVADEADEMVRTAIKTLEELNAAQALSTDEIRDMERLKGHELGAKADPGKFKSIFTAEKKALLFDYKLRQEISAQIASTLKIVDAAKSSHLLHEKALRSHESALFALKSNNLAEAYRLCREADIAYQHSGFNKGESNEEHKKLRAQVLKLTATVLQKVYRGHLGRRAFIEEVIDTVCMKQARTHNRINKRRHGIHNNTTTHNARTATTHSHAIE